MDRILIRPEVRIAEISRRLGISLADATPRLIEARRAMERGARPYGALYIPDDHNHLDPLGHDVVARLLLDRLALPAAAARRADGCAAMRRSDAVGAGYQGAAAKREVIQSLEG